MPNWCRNIVIPKDADALKKALVNEEGNVDFSKVIPRPADLDIIAGTIVWSGCCDHSYLKDNMLPILRETYADEITQKEFVEQATAKLFASSRGFKSHVKKLLGTSAFEVSTSLGQEFSNFDNVLKSFFNLYRYGYQHWYDWSIAKWGTKWNACETFCSNSTIEFDTAWDTPMGVWEELAKKHDFVVLFSDESASPQGALVAKDGDCHTRYLNYMDNTLSIYLHELIWGGGYCSEDLDPDCYCDFTPDEDTYNEACEIYKHYENYWRED